jgi:hypothetical protein
MQSKSVSRILMVAIPIMVVCGLLVAASSARVDQERGTGHDDGDTKVCTNKTLQGDYGSAVEGVLLNVPGLPPEAQFRAVVLTTYDGKGKFTTMEHTVVNGVPLEAGWTPGSGTYTVNPNCTGASVFNTPNSPVPLNLFFVVVRQGKEIHSVLDANALATVSIKVE